MAWTFRANAKTTRKGFSTYLLFYSIDSDFTCAVGVYALFFTNMRRCEIMSASVSVCILIGTSHYVDDANKIRMRLKFIMKYIFLTCLSFALTPTCAFYKCLYVLPLILCNTVTGTRSFPFAVLYWFENRISMHGLFLLFYTYIAHAHAFSLTFSLSFLSMFVSC